MKLKKGTDLLVRVDGVPMFFLSCRFFCFKKTVAVFLGRQRAPPKAPTGRSAIAAPVIKMLRHTTHKNEIVTHTHIYIYIIKELTQRDQAFQTARQSI